MKKNINSFEQSLKEILSITKVTFAGDFKSIRELGDQLFIDHHLVFGRNKSFERMLIEKLQGDPLDTTARRIIGILFKSYLIDLKKNGMSHSELCHFIHCLERITLDHLHKPEDQFQGTFLCSLLVDYLKSDLKMSVMQRIYLIGWVGKILATNTQDAQFDYSFNIIEELEKTFPQLPQKKTFKNLFEHPFDLWKEPRV